MSGSILQKSEHGGRDDLDAQLPIYVVVFIFKRLRQGSGDPWSPPSSGWAGRPVVGRDGRRALLREYSRTRFQTSADT